MADNFAVLLQILLDRNSAELTKKEVKKVTSLLKEADKAFKGQSLATFAKYTNEIGNAEKASSSFRREQKQLQREAKATAEVLRLLGDQQAVLNRQSAIANRRAGMLNSFGNKTAAAGLVIGGGIIAEATAYAKKMGDATEGTRAFNAELAKIESSRGRIDAVLASAVLPILQTATKVANLTAGILERNPELASFALKGASLLIAVGTLAKIAGTGFKIYADATYFTAQGIGLEAAHLQLTASTNQLLAAGKSGAGGLLPAAGGAGLLKFAAPVGILIAGALLLEIERKGLNKLLKSDQSFGDVALTFTRIFKLPAIAAASALAAAGLDKASDALLLITSEVDKFTQGLLGLKPAFKPEGALGAAGDASSLTTQRQADNSQKLIEPFIKMQDALLDAENKLASGRIDIANDAAASLLAATRSNASAISQINARALDDRSKIISNFVTASRDAERNFARDRANILRDSGNEIKQIEADRLEEIRKLEQDHNDRVGDLAANNDALGLVLEQRAFDRAKEEIDNQANKEIAQRRQDLAIKLQDLAANFAAERAQRIATYQQALKDNEAQRIADIKTQQDQFAEERRAIAANRAARLKDLQAQYNEERLRARESFIAQVRDLDASLLGEQSKKRQYYALMLSDVDKFLQDYRRRLGGSAIPGFAEGGYTGGGIIKAHAGEFIASQSTTRALEQMLGGRLSQQALLASAQNSMQYVDNSKYSGMTVADIRKVRRISREETIGALGSIFRS